MAEELKLTIKQARFLKEYFRTGNGLRSALKVYNCKNTHSAQAIASQNLSKLIIPIKDLMEAKKLSIGDLIDDVQEMRRAEKIHTSHTEPDRVVPDWSARAKAIEICSRWLGLGTPDQLTQIKVDVKPILGGASLNKEDVDLSEFVTEPAELVKPESAKPEPAKIKAKPKKKPKPKPILEPEPPAKPPKFSDVLAARAKRPRPQPVPPKINWPKPQPEQPDFDPDGFIPNDQDKFDEQGHY